MFGDTGERLSSFLEIPKSRGLGPGRRLEGGYKTFYTKYYVERDLTSCSSPEQIMEVAGTHGKLEKKREEKEWTHLAASLSGSGYP